MLASRLMLALAAVSIALGVCAQTAPEASAVEIARVALAQGRVAEARALLAEPARAGDAGARRALGVAHFLAGEPARAVEQLAPLLAAPPDDTPEKRETVQVLGLSYYLVGRIAESVPLLERARAFAGADPKLAYALGMAYVHTRQVDRARAAWAQAFAQPAESAAACLLNAQLMVRAGFDDLAEEELKRALARDPKLPQVRLLLGQTALFRGRLDEAVTLLDEERRLNPGNATVLDRLGDAYLRLGRWDEAIDVLQRSTWINPYSSNPYILLGRAHLKKSDAGSAEGLLRKAIEYDPNNQAAHYLLGQALQKLGRADEAKREFETAERLPGPVER